MKASQLFYSYLLLILLLLAGIARFHGLDRLSLWADELWVVMNSTQHSLWEMLQYVYYKDNHPPGYYLLSRYTQFLLGSSDFELRLPSALAGTALVAATYQITKKYFSQNAALIAAALVMGSYQAIYYSQEARPNIFVALFALLALHYFLVIVLFGEDERKNYYLYWLLGGLTSYFHYAGVVYILCLGLLLIPFLIFQPDKKKHLHNATKLFLPVLLVYLPWLWGTVHHLQATPVTAWQRAPDINTLKTTFWFLFGPDALRVLFYQIIFLASLVLMFIGKKRLVVFAVLFMMLMPVLVFFAKSSGAQSAYNHRHFLYAVPLLAVLAGYVSSLLIDKLPERFRLNTVLLIVILIIAYQYLANNSRALYTANHFKQEFRESAQVVVNDKEFINAANGIIVSNTPFFDHYLKRFSADQRASDFIYLRGDQMAELNAVLEQRHATAIYYLEAPYFPGANGMVTPEDQLLARHFQPLCRTRFARAQVIKYVIATPNLVDWTSLPSCNAQL